MLLEVVSFCVVVKGVVGFFFVFLVFDFLFFDLVFFWVKVFVIGECLFIEGVCKVYRV